MAVSRRIFRLSILTALAVALAGRWAHADSPRPAARDYATAMLLPGGETELSADYQAVNGDLDLLGVRDSSLRQLGDMAGARILARHGLSDSTTLSGAFSWRNLGLNKGLPHQDIFDWDLAAHHRVIELPHGPVVNLDLGVRGSFARDSQVTSVSGMNEYLHRVMGSSYSVRDTGSFLWFDRQQGDSVQSYGVDKAGKPAAAVSARGNVDVTPYVGLTAGLPVPVPFGLIYPSVHAEYGHTFIDGTIDTTLTAYLAGAPDFVSAILPAFPIDLARQEDYVKAGASLLVTLPYGVTGAVGYDYLRMFRGPSLGAEPANHILKGDLAWWVTPRFAVDVGAVYYQRQYNGVIPFLYNRYSESTFDHQYGNITVGLTWRFGG